VTAAVARYTVDGRSYESTVPVGSGAFVKAKVVGLDPTYRLILERTGDDEDIEIRDDWRVALDGRAFWTVPPATGG
jgi:hypothetical protein